MLRTSAVTGTSAAIPKGTRPICHGVGIDPPGLVLALLGPSIALICPVIMGIGGSVVSL